MENAVWDDVKMIEQDNLRLLFNPEKVRILVYGCILMYSVSEECVVTFQCDFLVYFFVSQYALK